MPALNQICRDNFGGLGPDRPSKAFSWYHLSLTTYGAWLPGDTRGFRTYRQKQYIDGDYRDPPPTGAYLARNAHAAALLTHPPVSLSVTQRETVGRALVERFRQLGAFVLTCAVTAQHTHCELNMPYIKRNEWVGAAKRHVWFEMRDRGWTGKVLGRRKKLLPIRTQSHQLNAFAYIVRHLEQGAWVWVWEGVADARLAKILAK